MTDYDELTKKILERLSKLDSPESEIKKRYNEEMERSRAKYEEMSQQIDADSALQKNTVAAQSLIDKKNTALKAEREGLSGAGVNVALEDSRQKKLDDSIEKIEEETKEAKQNLDEKLAKEIETLQTQEEKEYEKQRAALEEELEKLEKQKQKEEEAKAKEEAEKEKAKAEENQDSNEKSDEPNEDSEVEKEEPEEKYKPTVTAKELAKSIIERFGGDSKSIREYVEKLNNENNLDEEYLRDLNFALEAYGANETEDSLTGVTMSPSKIKELVDESQNYYKDAFGKVYNTFSKLGQSGAALAKKANEMARMVQMDFFYRSSANRGQFEALCNAAGIPNEEVADYYNRVEFMKKATKGGIVMGEYLRQ